MIMPNVKAIKQIPTEQLSENRSGAQFREDLSSEEQQSKIKMLALSIRKNELVNPIIVKPISEEKYEIVVGHRRYEAMAKILSKPTIPCIVLSDSVNVKSMKDIALIENSQREDLSKYELAKAIFDYKAEYPNMNNTSIGILTGLSKSSVSKYIQCYELINKNSSLREQFDRLGPRKFYEMLVLKNNKEDQGERKDRSKTRCFTISCLNFDDPKQVQKAIKRAETFLADLKNRLNELKVSP